VLPLVPGYLSTVTGVAVQDLEQASWRRVIGPALVFVASFSAIFILIGLTAYSVSRTLRGPTFEKVSGLLIIAMGVLFVSMLFVDRINRDWHFEALMARAGRGGPIVAGAAFAIAWTPCVGPTLTAILGLSANSGSALEGAVLLAIYSAGLAIPFLVTAVAFTKMTTAFDAVKRHYRGIIAAGGAVLIVMGWLVFTGELFRLNVEAQQFLDDLGLNFWSEI
jgi:cytochrome c-type biogenesis protein